MILNSGFSSRNDDYDNDFSRDGDKYNDMTTFAKMRAGMKTYYCIWGKSVNIVILLIECMIESTHTNAMHKTSSHSYCNLKMSK